jgi:hypothetical protein
LIITVSGLRQKCLREVIDVAPGIFEILLEATHIKLLTGEKVAPHLRDLHGVICSVRKLVKEMLIVVLRLTKPLHERSLPIFDQLSVQLLK